MLRKLFPGPSTACKAGAQDKPSIARAGVHLQSANLYVVEMERTKL